MILALAVCLILILAGATAYARHRARARRLLSRARLEQRLRDQEAWRRRMRAP